MDGQRVGEGPPPPRWTGPAVPPKPVTSPPSRAETAAPWIAVGVLVLVVGLAFSWVAGGGAEPLPTADGGYGLQVGACYTLTPEGAATSDCTVPHDLEAYHAFELPNGPYPSQDDLFVQITDECVIAFGPYVGTDYQDSVLDFDAAWPEEADWDAGERTVVCLLYHLEQDQLTGPARGSGI